MCSLVSIKAWKRLWKDATILKMLLNAIKRIDFMEKKQKSIRGLQFGNRHNIIDDLISAGVDHASDSMQYTGDADEVASVYVQCTGDSDKVIQHEYEVDDDPHEAVDNTRNPKMIKKRMMKKK